MSRKYKFHEKEGAYFVSFATVNWINVYKGYLFCNNDRIIRSLQEKQGYGDPAVRSVP